MRYAIIENGLVINITTADDVAFAAAQGWVVSDTAQIGDSYSAGVFTASSVTIDRDNLKAAIDARAQTERQKHASTIWGQETVYLEKAAEAKAIIADAAIADSETPYLTTEASVLGVPRAMLAQIVSDNEASWKTISVVIESNRMKLKALVDKFSDDQLSTIDIEGGWS